MVTPAYFLGVVYAGRPYAPIDASLPDKRIEKILENLCPRAIVADRESLEHVESIVDELAKAEGFDRPQIFIAEDISRFEQVACADSNCKISESAGDAVTDSENDTEKTEKRFLYCIVYESLYLCLVHATCLGHAFHLYISTGGSDIRIKTGSTGGYHFCRNVFTVQTVPSMMPRFTPTDRFLVSAKALVR